MLHGDITACCHAICMLQWLCVTLYRMLQCCNVTLCCMLQCDIALHVVMERRQRVTLDCYVVLQAAILQCMLQRNAAFCMAARQAGLLAHPVACSLWAQGQTKRPSCCCRCRLHELDASVCAQRVAQAFHSLLPQLCAQQEGVRFGTQQALKNLIDDCMDEAMIHRAVSHGSMRSATLPPAQNIVLAVANMLTVRHQDGWLNALSGRRPATLSSHAWLRQFRGDRFVHPVWLCVL